MSILQTLGIGFRKIGYYMFSERKQMIKVTILFQLLTDSGHIVKRERRVYGVEEGMHTYKFDSFGERWALHRVILKDLHDELHKDGNTIMEDAKVDEIVKDNRSEFISEVIAGVEWSMENHESKELSFYEWERMKVLMRNEQ